MAENTFTKEEVAALLERTAELQLQRNRVQDGRPGLTLGELEHIADEAGLDPALLREAAEEMTVVGTLGAGGARGIVRGKVGPSTSSTHNYIDRVVRGTCTDDALENMVAHLRNRFDTDLGAAFGSAYGSSSIERIGRNVEWKHTSLSGIETRVLVRARDEVMHVRFSQRVGLMSPMAESIGYGSVLSFFAALVSAAAMDSGVLGVVSFFAALALFAPLVFLLDTRWRASKHRQLSDLADEVTSLLSDDVPVQDAQTLPVRDGQPPSLLVTESELESFEEAEETEVAEGASLVSRRQRTR